MNKVIPIEIIEKKIFLIRNQKVMLDRDLAELYGVSTKRLNEQVKRNIKRFPQDFMFQLNEKEFDNLRSQIATSNRGGRRYMPYVFTENGVAMLSSILASDTAIEVNIQIMRAFTNLRKMILTHSELKTLIEKVEKQGLEIKDNKQGIHKLATLITQMLTVKKDSKTKKIGFQ